MNTWRGAVVMLASALVASAVLIGWFLLTLPRWEPLRDSASREQTEAAASLLFLEGFGLFFGSVFVSGRLAALLLIGRGAADGIAASVRWRLVPLRLVTGVVLLATRWALTGWAGVLTWDYALQFALGVFLVSSALRETWVHWVAPRIARASGNVGPLDS